MAKRRTTNPDEIKLNQYRKQQEALLANRDDFEKKIEKYEAEIEKIDEQLVQLGEKIETLEGKLRSSISLSWDTALLVVLVALLAWWMFSGPSKKPVVPAGLPTSIETGFFQEIPAGRNNVRCAQPDSNALKTALATGRFEVCLRLNGDGTARERGDLDHTQEKQICERYQSASGKQVRFIYLNIDQYDPGTYEYDRVLDEAQRLLERGGVITHCRNNMHRNGVVVGRFLRSKGFDDDEIIEHNNWSKLSESPGRYARYVNAVIQ